MQERCRPAENRYNVRSPRPMYLERTIVRLPLNIYQFLRAHLIDTRASISDEIRSAPKNSANSKSFPPLVMYK